MTMSKPYQHHRANASWCCVVFVCTLLLGCADAARDASQSEPVPTPEPVAAQIQISIVVDEQQRLCSREPVTTTPSPVTATLSVDGVLGDNLTVDCAANRLNHSLTGLSPGLHVFSIEVSLYNILIYRVSTQATLVAGGKHSLSFSNPQFVDSDGDGFSNLAEVIAFGRFSGAWLDASIRPAADLPRFSKNYVLTDQMGETFAGGSAGSANYLTSADF